MIATVDVELNAAHPQMPLKEFCAFTSSASSVRLRNVPKRIGLWEITSVTLEVCYPDRSLRSCKMVRQGSIWIGSIEGCSVEGAVVSGFQVLADGVDENGRAIEGYVLGVGDVHILSRDMVAKTSEGSFGLTKGIVLVSESGLVARKLYINEEGELMIDKV